MEGITPSLEVSGIDIRMGGKELVRQLSVVIPPGEFWVIAGPSGCGKTSLLQVLAGFQQPQRGKVVLKNGNLPVPYPAFRPQTGFIFQHLRLALSLDALTSVCCGRLSQYPFWQTLWGFPRESKEAAYRELFDLGLGKVLYRPVRDLSGGERQRVAIARTLHQKPRLLFADEPVANLDRANAQRVLARLRLEASHHQCSVVAVLHDETQTGLFADRVLRWDKDAPSLWKEERVRS